MVKVKFEVGDKVRIAHDYKVVGDKFDVIGGWVDGMRHCIGMETIITGFEYDKQACYLNGCGYLWDVRLLELVEDKRIKPETINIYREGKYTIAKTKVKGIVYEGKAACSPEDEYDFTIGAKLAFDRLIEKLKDIEYRVVCISDEAMDCTKGKIYTVKNGILVDDAGDIRRYSLIDVFFVRLIEE